jgi:putative membrane protein
MWGHGEEHFWGMHWIWWILWLGFISWIFLTPWDVPGQRRNSNSPLEILKKRYAAGEINKQEYEEMKKTIEK